MKSQVEKELPCSGGLRRLLLVRRRTHYAREEVPEMLNINPAMAEAITAQTADAYASQAATRPLAGFGAGAFTFEGGWAESQVNETAVALALPRIKSAVDGTGVRSAQAAALGATWLTSEVAKPDGAHA